MNKSVNIYTMYFYPNMISTAQYVTHLANKMAENNISVKIICSYSFFEKAPNLKLHKSIKIRHISFNIFPKTFLITNFLNQILYSLLASFYSFIDISSRTKAASTIVFTAPFFLPYFLFNRSKKMIISITDIYPQTFRVFSKNNRFNLLSSFFHYLNQKLYSNVNQVVVLGRCMLKTLKKQYKNLNLVYIPLWFQPSIIPNKIEQSKVLIDLGLKNKFVILYSGNFGRIHDFDVILKTASELMDHKDIIFLFVGRGNRFNYLKNLIIKYKLTNCIIRNFVNYNEFPALVKNIQVGLVSLSLGHEGLSVPSKFFGLLGAGKPTIFIGSNQSEVSQIIRDYNCGLSLDPSNPKALRSSILTLYNDQKLANEMSQNAIATASSIFNIQNGFLKYNQLIN